MAPEENCASATKLKRRKSRLRVIWMDERTKIAAQAMEGILVGMFAERPTVKPPPSKVAVMAVTYAEALLDALKEAGPHEDVS